MSVISELHDGIQSFVLSSQGSFLATSFDQSLWTGSSPELQPLSTQSRVFNGEPFSYLLRPLDKNEPTGPWLGVGLSKIEVERFQERLVLSLAMAALILASLATLATYFVALRITRPVSELVNAVEKMREGVWVEALPSQNQKELAFLTERFNEMAQDVQATHKDLQEKLEELATAQNQLVQSAKLSSLGQLVAGVAHELNNPIAFIYSNMSQLRNNIEALKSLDQHIRGLILSSEERERLEHFLSSIHWRTLLEDLSDIANSSLEGSVRVKDIVFGLRNFSRLDPHRFEEAELRGLLESSAKMLQHEWRGRVDFVWELTETPHLTCYPTQLQQVFLNLFANAIQAIKGRGQITVKTDLMRRADGVFAEVRIRDSGEGISSENLPKIFDPFFTTKGLGKGTGLGLSIVYGIVKKHQGEIEVTSRTRGEADSGTEFRILLPVQVKGSKVPESKAS